jgi:dihydroorotase-like cyclic amidohydrolase
MYEGMLSGIGIICFMPNTSPSIDNCETLEQYIELIKDAEEKLNQEVKGYVWVALTDNNHDEVIKMLSYEKVVGVKIYPLKNDGTSMTTGAVGIKNWKSLEKLLQMMKEKGIDKPIAGHWEDPNLGHGIDSEVSALTKLVDLVKKYPFFRYMACHLTSKKGVEVISKAQKLGLKIMIELTPHHLHFASDETFDIKKGILMCYPPIRDIVNRSFLRTFLMENSDSSLICIGSDSAPHLKKDKEKDEPNRGLATLQHMIPVILGVSSILNLSKSRIENILSNNAADFLCLPRQTKTKVWQYCRHVDNKVYNEGKVPNPFKGFVMSYKSIDK